jgi:hypothetical protein
MNQKEPASLDAIHQMLPSQASGVPAGTTEIVIVVGERNSVFGRQPCDKSVFGVGQIVTEAEGWFTAVSWLSIRSIRLTTENQILTSQY